MEGVIGYTTPFAGNFAPRNWAMCQGQILAITSNTALFSILGTTYGGNGTTTFALPDLRGRAVMSAGQGPGLSPYSLGQVSGAESATLISTQLPNHAHPVAVTVTPKAAAAPNSASPAGAVYGTGNDTLYDFSTDTNLKPYTGALTTGPTGNSVPFSIVDPLLTLNYLICLQGVFPARN
jgi:microcystin-dependent protein